MDARIILKEIGSRINNIGTIVDTDTNNDETTSYGDETYTVGTNYYGGANVNVSIIFTPQSTITNGSYSSRPITAPNIAELEQRIAALESKA